MTTSFMIMATSTNRMALKALRKYVALLDRNIERYLLVVTYIYITFIIVIGVFNRFVLQSASGWEQETARLMFIWLTWIGASLAVRKRSHIRIDFIYQYVSERTKGLLYVFSDIVIIVFCVVAFDAFIPVLQTTLDFGASLVTLNLSQIFFQAAIPTGLMLITIRAIQMLLRDITDVRNGNEMYEGEPLFEIHGENEG
jgi:TRAP-type C4-dicarboxylate transport system permease small subunit